MAVRPQPSATRLPGKLYAPTQTDMLDQHAGDSGIPCMKTSCCGRRRLQSPPQGRSVKSSFAAREGAGASNEPQSESAAQPCNEHLLKINNSRLHHSICPLPWSCADRLLHCPPQESHPKVHHFTSQGRCSRTRRSDDYLRPLKLPERANKLHNFPQAMLRPRQRANGRLPSPFTRLSLDVYLTSPRYDRRSNASQLARTSLQPGVFQNLALGTP